MAFCRMRGQGEPDMIIRAAGVAVFLFAALTNASAQTPAPEKQQPKPLGPGGLRVTPHNPLPGNWVCQGAACTCKPLACAASAKVSYTLAPSPARRPDPKALERF